LEEAWEVSSEVSSEVVELLEESSEVLGLWEESSEALESSEASELG
jgi:hypothetical protein